MLTTKNFTLILFTALTTCALVAFAQTEKTMPTVMSSTAIEWNSIPPKANANGSGRKFFEGPSPTLDMIECHASTLNPGAMNHEILKRDFDEVIIIKEGTIEVYTGTKWVTVGAGSVIFNAAGTDQAMRNTSNAPTTYHVVSVRPPAAAKPAK